MPQKTTTTKKYNCISMQYTYTYAQNLQSHLKPDHSTGLGSQRSRMNLSPCPQKKRYQSGHCHIVTYQQPTAQPGNRTAPDKQPASLPIAAAADLSAVRT